MVMVTWTDDSSFTFHKLKVHIFVRFIDLLLIYSIFVE